MAISIRRYVDITSGVGAGASVRQRDLIARLFTTNELVPTQSIVEMTDLTDVANYFGTTSEEYLRAVYYFGFVSKNITRPKRIAFARWANVDTGAQIFGADATTTLASYTAVTAGVFTITLAGVDGEVTGLDLSSASSLADVAASVQAAIRALTGTFATAEVTFNPTGGRFEFDSGSTGPETIAVTDGAQTPLEIMGWVQPQTVLSNGVDAETVVDTLTLTTDMTNNFGSFLFMPTLTDEQYVSAANWNQTENVAFQFMVPVTETTAVALSGLLIGISGVAMTLTNPAHNEYPEMLPMVVLASTNYSARNSVQNYMFQIDSRLSPTVTTTANANIYDPLRVNYYGRTQTAGQFIDFYQRGVLGGGPTAPVDMNTFANEQWLKDFATASFLSLLTSLARVSANNAGRSQLTTVLETITDAGLLNGTISVGRTLNVNQRLFISEQSGDPLAYIDVENNGFWNEVTFRVDTNTDGSTTTVAVYTLIYAKDDVVRKVEGSHVLI